MNLKKVTILRTTAELDEGERPEYQAGPRTILVVTSAVLDYYIGSGEYSDEGRWVFEVTGYRKQNPRGQWYTGGTFTKATRIPEPLYDLYRKLAGL